MPAAAVRAMSVQGGENLADYNYSNILWLDAIAATIQKKPVDKTYTLYFKVENTSYM